MHPVRIKFALTLACAGLAAAATGRAQQEPKEATPPAAEQVLELEPFEVVTTSNRGYGATTVSGATRTNVKLEDLPQTITVVNDQFLKDIAAFSLDEALAYAPSVKARSWDNDGHVFIRGFSTDTGSATLAGAAYAYRNGMRLPVGYTADFANIDRIEIVKGPAAAVAGRGAPGGLINYVTKRPLFGTQRAEASVVVGSDNYLRGQVDLNVPLSPESKKAAARFILEDTHSDFWRAGSAEIKSLSITPSVRAKLSDKVEVIVEAEYTDQERPNDFGMPYNTLDRQWTSFDYSVSEPWAVRTEEFIGGWASVNYQPTSWLTLRQQFSTVQRHTHQNFVWTDSINRAAAGDGSGFAAGEIYFKRHLNDNEYDNKAVNAQGDAVFNFRFPAARISSQTMVSYEWQRASYDIVQNTAALTPISLNNPIYGNAPTNYAFVSSTQEDLDLFSYMASEQLGFFDDRVIASASWRHDESDGIQRKNRATGVTTQDPASEVSHPRYGLVVKPWEHVSLYGVYSESADPISTTYRFSQIAPTDPRNSVLTIDLHTELKEVGVKSDLFDGRLMGTLAFYQIQRFGGTYQTALDGPAQSDPATAGLLETIISPAAESKGVELELTATISRKLMLYGSFQRMQTRSFNGTRWLEFRGVPHWSASFYANYDFRRGAPVGFMVRAGTILQGRQQADNNNTYQIDSDPRFDAGVTYTMPGWTFNLSVNNITDAIVPTNFAAFRSNSVLPPRQVRCSIVKTW